MDIYSLGITFFEMCYPFNTSMERAKTLCELRRPEIHVPDHFRQKSFSRHVNRKFVEFSRIEMLSLSVRVIGSNAHS